MDRWRHETFVGAGGLYFVVLSVLELNNMQSRLAQLTGPPTSASQGLGLKACTTTSSSIRLFTAIFTSEISVSLSDCPSLGKQVKAIPFLPPWPKIFKQYKNFRFTL